jgi:hypothetical protein
MSYENKSARIFSPYRPRIELYGSLCFGSDDE